MALTNDARATFMAIVKGDASQAVTEFKRMGNSIEKSTRQAQGSVGKFQSITTQAMSSIKANAGLMAAAAGAAIAAFAFKGMQDFIGLSKAALDFSAATGMSVESASRWIAVADDAGISAESLQTAFAKLAKDVDGDRWRKYGIDTRTASGDVRNSNEVLLDALDVLGRTGNATERAAIGNELFGKSYSALAPLVGRTREQYKAMLAAVEDGQVITAQEAQRAEEMRLAQDALADSAKELQLAFGEMLTSLSPLFSMATTGMQGVAKALGAMFGTDEKSIAGPVFTFIEATDKANASVTDVGQAFKELQGAAYDSRSTMDTWFGGGDTWEATKKAFGELKSESVAASRSALKWLDDTLSRAEAGDAVAQAEIDRLGLNRQRYDELNMSPEQYMLTSAGSLALSKEEAQARKDAADAVWDQYNAVMAIANADLGVSGAVRNLQDAQDAFRTTTDDARTTKNEVEEAGDCVKQAIFGVASAYVEQQRAVTEAAGAEYAGSQATKDQIATLEYLRDTLSPGDPLRQYLQGYIEQLANIPPEVATDITVRLKTSEFDRLQAMYSARLPQRATGGSASGMTLVGENGPEIANLPQGTWVSNAAETQRLLRQASVPAGGPAARPTTVQVNVNVPPTSNPIETGRAVADALRSYYRNGGQPV